MIKKIIIWLICVCCCGVVSAQSYHIGDVYIAPDGSKGIVYYLHPDGSGGWVVALNDVSAACVWGDNTDVPGLLNYNTQEQQLLNDTAGYANTLALRNYQNNNSYAAGVVDFAHGWVLPSPAQLSKLYAQLPFISSALTGAGGTEPTTDFYWCSAEYSASNAWCIDFGSTSNYHLYSGQFYNTAKNTSCRVRAVRRFDYSSGSNISYLWNTGATTTSVTVSPAQTTTYTVTVTTSNGCSDTAQHTILVNVPVGESINAIACDSYAWNGTTYYESGDYTYAHLDANGCTQVDTLHLTVNSSVTEHVEATACGSYVWNDSTYTESGSHTMTFTATNGCDSVVTLELTVSVIISEVTVTATADTICVGTEVTLDAVVHNIAAFVTHPTPPSIAVGDILCTDGTTVKPSAYAASGKVGMGVVLYVNESGHGWAINLHEEGEYAWSTVYSGNIPDAIIHDTPAEAIADYNGSYNTYAIRSVTNPSLYPAAMAVDYANGWYLPASGQLYLMYALMPILNESLAICGGTPFVFNSNWKYCSSTVAVARNMWSLDHSGYIIHYLPNLLYRVRSMRDF